MLINRMNRDMIAVTVMPLVTGLAFVWLAFEAANLTWIVLEDSSSRPPERGVAVVVSQQTNSRSVASLSDITQYHLFGQERGEASVVVAPKRAVINAPQTRLNLTLRGLFASENGAFALISSGKDDEQVYKVGMLINPSTRIDAIHVDSVVLNRGGRLEVLYLKDDAQALKGGKRPSEKKRIANRSTRFMGQRSKAGGSNSKLREHRERLIKNPQEAMRFAKIQPVMQRGKLSGYRVNPGSDPTLFEQLGFKAKDLVKVINGIAVDDPTKIGALMTQLTSAKQLTITIERRGRIENLLIEF